MHSKKDVFKIIKLDDNAKYVTSDLKAIPELFLESHQLSSIILEYKRECGSSDIVQSLCDLEEDPTQEASELDMIRGVHF
ncbi:palmitoyl-acyl carrier protein thioesterase, chloroplastic-like protein [Cinnamomum micranthum f. kanehirae]|uniref:Palmitoyl-acyl carrier protein thioesterase, chloroplastic-like protein n=1 Tax=Cinnamomum micranthum f. kanehirae TaxID=337451 RepID=A0A3S3ML21_9MAGN|nr:palmitoyl-acyl carrier protein thioesterase, chloroplastic-like protein [Cinnamomum micranthum f. kanehirae]